MAFPTTSLLTSFTGTDEDPLSEGGNWGGLTNTTWQYLRRVGNVCGKSSTLTNNAAGQYWAATQFGSDQEAWVTLSSYISGDALWVSARLQNPGNISTQTHYHAQWNGTNFSIVRFVGTSNTAIATTAGSMSVGDKIGIECIGSTIRCLHYTSGAWVERCSVVDGTISGPGYTGVGVYALGSIGTVRVDDFGGGAVASGLRSTTFMSGVGW